MRFSRVLPLAALSAAFVIPDEQTMNQVAIEDHRDISYLDAAKGRLNEAVDNTKSAIDSASDSVSEYAEEKYFDAENWISDFNRAHEAEYDLAAEEIEVAEDVVHGHLDNMRAMAHDWRKDLGIFEGSHKPCHDKERKKGKKGKKGFSWFRKAEKDERHHEPGHGHDDDDDHHHKPGHGKKPHHGPGHHHKSNLTVYQLIQKSNYTTKLAKLIDEFPEVVEKLNGTEANFTFFAPTDKAFEKIPDHGKKPPKEFLLKILQYHVVPDLYPATRVLKSRTLATVLEGSFLSEEPIKTPQRLSINLSLRGLTLNFYSRIVGVDIFGSNGIIHGIDSILVPPPKAAKIVQLLPGEFSTLELGLFKTGLFFGLNNTDTHLGGTLFAPSNGAWQRLGPKATGFLFSKYGRKYLKALLEYHIVPNITLYSDALYTKDGKGGEDKESMRSKRTFHVDLPTLLDDKYLSVDIARFARFIDVRINGFNHATVLDGIALDGVIQVVGSVIIPPKTPGGKAEMLDGEIDVNELKQRLEPFVKEEVEDPSFVEVEEEQEYRIQELSLEL